MSARTNECTLPLPSGMDCIRCLSRFESEIAQIPGVQYAALDTRCATLCVTYSGVDLTSSSLAAEALRIGQEIASTVGHHLIGLEDLHCPDCAANIQRQPLRMAGVLWAEVNFLAARVAVEYEIDKTTLASICREIERRGVRTSPARTLPHETIHGAWARSRSR